MCRSEPCPSQVVVRPTAKYTQATISLMGLPVHSGHAAHPLVVSDEPSKAVVEVRRQRTSVWTLFAMFRLPRLLHPSSNAVR